MLLSELKADENGMVWLGEKGEKCVVIRARMAGIVLRGWALYRWREEGQKR